MPNPLVRALDVSAGVVRAGVASAGVVRTGVVRTGVVQALVVAVALVSGGAAPAATLHGATSLHVFGDSLSDTGRISDLSFGRIPGSRYWRGRFSNGPVWADHVAEAFAAAGVARSNRAYGGARALTNRDGVPDLAYQVDRYRDLPRRRRGATPLAAIAIGGNDVLARVGRDDVRTAGRRAADAVADATRALSRRGVESFMLINLPDLGALPRYAGGEPARIRSARAGSTAFNNRLDRRIGELRRDGLEVRLFDAFSLFGAIVADPADFGLTDARTPCLLQSGGRCSAAEAATRAFYDDIHPTAAVHAIFAEQILAGLGAPAPGADRAPATTVATAPAAQVAPVPLPAPAALLIAAIGGLGLLAARRRVNCASGPPSCPR